MQQETKAIPSVTQVARAFLLSGQGRNTAPDIKFEARFPEQAIRLVLNHIEVAGIKPLAELLAGQMASALMSAAEDPSPMAGYLDTRTANCESSVYQTLKDALAIVRDCKEVASEHRLAASDLLGELK